MSKSKFRKVKVPNVKVKVLKVKVKVKVPKSQSPVFNNAIQQCDPCYQQCDSTMRFLLSTLRRVCLAGARFMEGVLLSGIAPIDLSFDRSCLVIMFMNRVLYLCIICMPSCMRMDHARDLEFPS